MSSSLNLKTCVPPSVRPGLDDARVDVRCSPGASAAGCATHARRRRRPLRSTGAASRGRRLLRRRRARGRRAASGAAGLLLRERSAWPPRQRAPERPARSERRARDEGPLHRESTPIEPQACFYGDRLPTSSPAAGEETGGQVGKPEPGRARRGGAPARRRPGRRPRRRHVLLGVGAQRVIARRVREEALEVAAPRRPGASGSRRRGRRG